MAASRLQRYAIYLSAYNYEIQYITSENNAIADYFSRAPLCDSHTELDIDESATYLNFLDEASLPISFEDVKSAVAADRTLQTVMKYVRNGWPRKITCRNIKPFFHCKADLELDKGCIMRGHRIIVPSALREIMLNELHRGHFGIVKTKGLARGRMWWPGIDSDIESMVGACATCGALRAAPLQVPPAPWPRPLASWERIHIDYMQIRQMVYLVVIDAYSKWVECILMGNGLNTKCLIQKLKTLFSTFGIPKVIVSDNDPKISNVEFSEFCKRAGFKHLTSPIYHACSNGQAENSVKTCKKMIKCILQNVDSSSTSVQEAEKLLSFLFEYRTTPHCSTGETPAKLMFNRELRCRLDLLLPPKPNVAITSAAVELHKSRIFYKGQKVWVRCYQGRKPFWKIGEIIGSLGNRMYNVSVEGLGIRIRHIDQLLRFSNDKKIVSGEHSSTQTLPEPSFSVNRSKGRFSNKNHNETLTRYSVTECDSSRVAPVGNGQSPLSPAKRVVVETQHSPQAELPLQCRRSVSLAPEPAQLRASQTNNQSEMAARHHYNLRPRPKVINYKE